MAHDNSRAFRERDRWLTAGPDEPPEWECTVCELAWEDCTCDEPTPPYVPDEMDRADVMRDRMKDEPTNGRRR